MPVRAERARGVLVSDEAREAARRRPVVGLLRRRLHLLPDGDGVRIAVDAGGVAEIEAFHRMVAEEGIRAERRQPRDGRVVLLRRRRLDFSEQLAGHDVEDGRAGRRAEVDLAEELRVIRDGREVERPIDGGAPRLDLSVVDDRDRGAARERVGVARADARAEDVRVGREARMDVEVAEEGLAEVGRAGAGLARLGPLPGRRRGGGRDGRRDQEERGEPMRVHARAVTRSRPGCRVA